MRQGAVITRSADQDIEHGARPLEPLLARDPAALDRDHQRHECEARAARRDEIAALPFAGGSPVGHQAAHGVRGLPEEAEGLPLHALEQLVIAKSGEPRRAHILESEGIGHGAQLLPSRRWEVLPRMPAGSAARPAGHLTRWTTRAKSGS